MSIKQAFRVFRVSLEDRRYRARARRLGLTYAPDAIAERIDGEALTRALEDGNLRIFAAVRHHNWEGHNLIPALEKFGEVTHFDWGKEGFAEENRWDATEKRRMNRLLLERLDTALAAEPMHLFFGYLSGRNVYPETIRAIRERGLVTVNLALDDRAKFVSRKKYGYRFGNSEIAQAFDLCCTSTASALPKYLVEGGNPLLLPEGANPEVYRPVGGGFRHDVSFIGQCYGMRPGVIAELKRRGIEVATFGYGWPGGPVPVERMVEIYGESRINLGFGGVGVSDKLVCLKGRDFEIPMSGGLYLTQHNPELSLVYRVGEEIMTYRTPDELAERITHLLNHPDEADRIRKAGHARALAEHTWEHRMATVLGRALGFTPESIPRRT
ncbi:MAG: glycosyltransferase [Leptospirillia bacterium]